ncbi:hypothetical protein [Caulobacter phage Cr30]|uniref:hypothetical protein n=1 Tax=Caulobacter phage Cr30 TaxID=1357714 RepID=UPI0004A9B3E2|nr:hypothetical protein OZ74_gp274 [Caulobacter phage Cr30]AGS81069.1 hypothetical protein [Caulobacter phage Cr30]
MPTAADIVDGVLSREFDKLDNAFNALMDLKIGPKVDATREKVIASFNGKNMKGAE